MTTETTRSKQSDDDDDVSWMFGGLSVNFQGHQKKNYKDQESTDHSTTVVQKTTSDDHTKQSSGRGGKSKFWPPLHKTPSTETTDDENTDPTTTSTRADRRRSASTSRSRRNNNNKEKADASHESSNNEHARSTSKRDWRLLGRKGEPSPAGDHHHTEQPGNNNTTTTTTTRGNHGGKDAPSSISSSPQDMSKQRQAVYRAFGGSPYESIRVEQREAGPIVPKNDNHVVVKIVASTISMQDCILRRGFDFNMMDPVSLPVTPGHDFAGHVVARGNHVTDDRIPLGALVVGLVRTGGNGRFISVPVDSIIPVPRKIGPEEAVCMVSIYATALHCLKLGSRRHLLFSMDDQKVLVIGGMDGVGHALVDWCKRAKAEVYVTAPENRHLYIKTSLGAKPLPENPEEWPAELQGQMDMVFDGVGHTVSPAVLASLKPDHSLVCYGKSSLLKQRMGMFGAPLSAHLDRFQTMFSSNIKVVDLWKSYRSDPEAYKRNVETLFQSLQTKKIKPNIVHRVALDEVGQYHDKLESGQARGILLCLPWKKVSKKRIFRVTIDSCRPRTQEEEDPVVATD